MPLLIRNDKSERRKAKLWPLAPLPSVEAHISNPVASALIGDMNLQGLLSPGAFHQMSRTYCLFKHSFRLTVRQWHEKVSSGEIVCDFISNFSRNIGPDTNDRHPSVHFTNIVLSYGRCFEALAKNTAAGDVLCDGFVEGRPDHRDWLMNETMSGMVPLWVQTGASIGSSIACPKARL